MMLSNQETMFQHVYTQLTLEKVGAGGVEYGKVTFKNIGSVPDEYHPQLESYQEGLTRILGTQVLDVIPDEENVADADAGAAAEPGAGGP